MTKTEAGRRAAGAAEAAQKEGFRRKRAAALGAAGLMALAAAAAAEGREDVGPPLDGFLPDPVLEIQGAVEIGPNDYLTPQALHVAPGGSLSVADGWLLDLEVAVLEGSLSVSGETALMAGPGDGAAGIPRFEAAKGRIDIEAHSTADEAQANFASAGLYVGALHVTERLDVEIRETAQDLLAAPTATFSAQSIALEDGAELWVGVKPHGAFIVGSGEGSLFNLNGALDAMTPFGDGVAAELSNRAVFVAAGPVCITQGMHIAVGGEGWGQAASAASPNLLIAEDGVLFVAEQSSAADAPAVTFEAGSSVAFEKGAEIWLADSFGDAEAAQDAERIVLGGISFAGAALSGEENAVVRWNGYEGELALGEGGELTAILRPLEFGGDFSALLAHAWERRRELFLPKIFKRAFREFSGDAVSRAVSAAAAAPYALGTHARMREMAAGFGADAFRLAAQAQADAEKAEALRRERAKAAAEEAAQKERQASDAESGKAGELASAGLWSQALQSAQRMKEQILYTPIYVSVESCRGQVEHRSPEGLLSQAERDESGAAIAAVGGWDDIRIGLSAAYRSADIKQRHETAELAASGQSDVLSASLWAVKPLAGGWLGAADLFYISASDDAELAVLRTRFEARGIDRKLWGGGLSLRTPEWQSGVFKGAFSGGLRYVQTADASYQISAEGEAALDVKERGRASAAAVAGAELSASAPLAGLWTSFSPEVSKHLPQRIDAALHAGAAIYAGGRSLHADYALASGFGGPGASVSHEGPARAVFDASASVSLDFETMRLGVDVFADAAGSGWRSWGGRIRLDMLLDA